MAAIESQEKRDKRLSEVEPERWSTKADYLLSLIGATVGLGNLLRFPFLCYRNGGGAFLVPYCLMTLLLGLPLLLLELSVGQYSSRTFVKAWTITPLLRGIGHCIFLVKWMSCPLYGMTMTYSYFYLFESFTSPLPWTTCCNEWNTPWCVDRAANATDRICNRTNIVKPELNHSTFSEYSLRNASNATHTSSEEFFNNYVLKISSGLDDYGVPDWQLCLLALLCYTVVFLCVVKGIRITGKIVYVTAILPYAILLILLVRGLSLEGASTGIVYFLKPRWGQLLTPKVWGDAAVQIFYSLGLAGGAAVTLSSYGKFNDNCYRDVFLIGVVNMLTSFLAGFLIFSCLGHMSLYTGLPMDEVVVGGPGLAFVAFPEVISLMPASAVWSVLFFVMILMLGIDSHFVDLDLLTAGIEDFLGSKCLHKYRRGIIRLFLCVAGFCISVIYSCPGGMYLQNLIDWYGLLFPFLTVALLQTVSVSWIYGYKRLLDDINCMLGFKPSCFWSACWLVLTPTLLLFIVIFNAVIFAPAVYGKYTYSESALNCAWLTVIITIGFIPVMAVVTCVQFYKRDNRQMSFRQLLREVTTPPKDWDHNRCNTNTSVIISENKESPPEKNQPETLALI